MIADNYVICVACYYAVIQHLFLLLVFLSIHFSLLFQLGVDRLDEMDDDTSIS